MDSVGNEEIKRKNPRATANILSALSFAWTYSLFRRGFKRELEISDLCEPLPEHTAHLLGNELEEHWNKELEAHRTNPKRTPSLIRVFLRLYGGKIFLYPLFVFSFELSTKIAQPLFLGQLIQHFTPNSTVTDHEAKLYAAGLVLCASLQVITISPCILALLHLGMKVRVATCSIIYRKSLRLSQEAKAEIGAGHIINLLSNDASRFDWPFLFLPDIFIGPTITIIASYIIWREVGILALIGVAILCLFIPIQSILAKKTASLRERIASKSDHRIRLMSEIVAGIQVIKMYAWEKPFGKLVSLARIKEVNVIREKAFTLGILNTCSVFSTKLALFVSMLAYAFSSDVIRADVVFTMVMCYSIIQDNFVSYFPTAVKCLSESYVSFKRVETFLMKDEATDVIVEKPLSKGTSGNVKMMNICAKWSSDNKDNTLENLNVNIQSGSLVAVIGSVGSGKSSFLQLILKELPVVSGNIEVDSTISYASQEPWLFGETVCQNILFGLPMDRNKYQKVVSVCALERDFEQLPHGDKTLIGDRGVCLSGGQKARVNLARAVYRDADIYLLDDPLSAVDSHVGRHLFDECICGYLAGKTVVLATHHVHRLANVGHIIKLDGGKIVAQGSFHELCEKGVDLTVPQESAPKNQEVTEQNTKNTSVKDESKEDSSKNTEIRSKGRVGASVYMAYLKAVKNAPLVVCVIALFILFITVTSGSEYWLSFWVNNEEYVFPNDDPILIPWFGELNRTFCLAVYGILIGTLFTLAITRVILYYIMCMRASRNLHDDLFTSISEATMKFFNNTPSGQILNRFSRDTGIIDETLPETLADGLRAGLQNVGSLIIIFIINSYLMVPFLGVLLVLYIVRLYYVSTSRSIKRIESVTRSPMYTHVNASLQGLTTIRAMRAETRLSKEFDHKMDAHSSAWYYILGTNRAFAYVLDLTCCVYTSVVTFSFLVLKDQFLGGDVGLAITQSLGLTVTVQWFVRQSAEIENLMTSVERVCEFGQVETENEHTITTSDQKLDGWPSQGAVEYSDVSLYYDSDGLPALKNVGFNIQPGEKIGVVGRTGAGKSSLVAALFRLQNLKGKITIDGVDTCTARLQNFRSKISIIPQDPVIFSGTMRFNLDPFEEYSDSDLWNALEAVELKSVIKDSQGGLHTNLAEGGVNLSVGQRQLVCLARAILRNSKVLVLDEATANVDTDTDDFIQAAIRKRFAHCTVITIAHRLHTIMDSDRILVMDNGTVVESGPPKVLLLHEKSHFKYLVELEGLLTNEIADISTNKSEK